MTINQDARTTNLQRQQRLMAAGGLVGALAASSCCILPLVLFSLGVSGAWQFYPARTLSALLHRGNHRLPRLRLLAGISIHEARLCRCLRAPATEPAC